MARTPLRTLLSVIAGCSATLPDDLEDAAQQVTAAACPDAVVQSLITAADAQHPAIQLRCSLRIPRDRNRQPRTITKKAAA